jgi:hypothetical protein
MKNKTCEHSGVEVPPKEEKIVIEDVTIGEDIAYDGSPTESAAIFYLDALIPYIGKRGRLEFYPEKDIGE